MRKVAFIVSHLGSDSNYLVDVLNNNPRCLIFNSSNTYDHPDSLNWLFSRHKLKNFAGAIYGDHLLYNQSFSCKLLYEYCKFIYVIGSPKKALNEIYKMGYKKQSAFNYYCFRLRRICEMAKCTKNAVLLTRDELINHNNFDIIEKYLNLIQPLVSTRLDGEVEMYNNVFAEPMLRKAEDCYERYFYYLNNIGLKRP